ncbi:MAG TPA: Rrf2 family transcriptional regulator [Magnetospirillum sp.]|jgi:Rrf2 family nitric oxide-sensitive transcriptional repressor|nr:Rrf2 family transcriptional regulator [Magnetospirillum sp.]
MRLTLHTDYALRVLVHVGLRNGELVTISEIADCYAISKNHLTKVVHQLGRAGYLETVRGKYGGVRLLVQPEDVRLGDFVRRTEDDFALARCMREDNACDEETCLLEGSCIARLAFGQGLAAFFETLNHYTVADMIAAESRRGRVREQACA